MRETVFSTAHTETLLSDLRRANTEQAKKELFNQYLTRAFIKDKGAQGLISALAKGAERTIANIPRAHGIARGRADTQTDTVIIEWEKDLSKTGPHAIDQLREYLIGNWKSGKEYRFVLIATDGIRWRIYAPDWSHLKNQSFSLGDEFELREIRKFDLSEDNADDFPFFLDEILFVSIQKLATLERVETDFGSTSATFINCMRALKQCEKEITRKSELRTAYDQWRRFLSIAYGRFDDSPGMFLVHTYLSVFAKLLAFAVIGKRPIKDDAMLRDILNGKVFEEQLLVERFVEDDFFHWVSASEHFKSLKPMFRELIRQIDEYDFSTIQEDILKGVYQELIDLDTRHALGEYFTPDWLCERMVEELPLQKTSSVLDPACGSGSFLRAAIARLRNENPKITAEELAGQICGIDIHPLSVQIAKTTVLLALGGVIEKAKKPITLNIYLANSLLVPQETADLFKSTFKISIDNKVYAVNIGSAMTQEQFDLLITFCDDLVDRYPKQLPRQRFIDLIAQSVPLDHEKSLPGQLYDVYGALKGAKDAGRDSIWKFILQNVYKPVFLKNRFDFVVGNPPWLTYSAISNADYQAEIKRLADDYNVTPAHKANMPHLEIASVFLAHSINYFLKPSGVLAFVLPRSFISADQHDRTRAGQAVGVKLKGVWDLDKVSPMFRVPSCVFFSIFGTREEGGSPVPASGIEGCVISGHLPKFQIRWAAAQSKLQIEKTRWYYSQLSAGKKRSRSALTTKPGESLVGSNAYTNKFKQGATIVPRSFYFVEPEGDLGEEELKDRTIILRPSPSMLSESKAPWKDHTISGKMEGRFLFRTAVSKNMVPFFVVHPLFVVLPLRVEKDSGGVDRFKLSGHEELLKGGARFASHWFLEAERLWDKYKTDKAKRKAISYLDWLNFRYKLTDQDPNARFLVLYTGSATDASAAVVDRSKYNAPFIVEHKTYGCEVASEAEGNYLCAYLNSGYANEKIKDFQSRGLFGPRDIHKTIVQLPFPNFDSRNEDHQKLARLAMQCADRVRKFMDQNENIDLNPRTLGRTRSKIREFLGGELDEIDVLVEKLSSGKSEAAIRSSGKGRSRRKGTLPLFE